MQDPEVPISSVPDWVRQAAYSVFDCHEPGVPSLPLVFDNLVDDDEYSRSDDDDEPVRVRHLRFESSTHRVAMRVSRVPECLSLDLHVEPAGRYDVVVRQDRPPLHLRTDEHGCVSTVVTSGLVSLLVARADGAGPVRTAWVRL